MFVYKLRKTSCLGSRREASRYALCGSTPDETGHRATLTQRRKDRFSRVEPKGKRVFTRANAPRCWSTSLLCPHDAVAHGGGRHR